MFSDRKREREAVDTREKVEKASNSSNSREEENVAERDHRLGTDDDLLSRAVDETKEEIEGMSMKVRRRR